MELSSLPKEQLIELLRVYARQLMAVDGYWFMAVEDRFGPEAALELDCWVWERASGAEARRLARCLGLDGQRIEDILAAFSLSPGWLHLGVRTEVTGERRGLVTCTDCHVQKNRARLGREEFACKPVGEVLVASFVRALNPEARVRCLVCPPDPHPPDVWCRWEIEI